MPVLTNVFNPKPIIRVTVAGPDTSPELVGGGKTYNVVAGTFAEAEARVAPQLKDGEKIIFMKLCEEEFLSNESNVLSKYL